MSGVLRIHRFEVPVNDHWHTIPLTGPILHVGGRSVWTVEFWALAGRWPQDQHYEFRVYGTGHQLPAEGWQYVGSVVHPDLVWHLVVRRLTDVVDVEITVPVPEYR